MYARTEQAQIQQDLLRASLTRRESQRQAVSATPYARTATPKSKEHEESRNTSSLKGNNNLPITKHKG